MSRPAARPVTICLALLATAGPAAAQRGTSASVREGLLGGPPAEACDPERLRALGEFQTRLRAPAALARAGGSRPGGARGYLGLRLSEVSATAWTPEGRLVRYCAYPLVVSVEPASPAERAGVDAGDTLLAYAGHDLVRGGPVALDQLLVPGATLRVHLRRNGRTVTRAVTVGRAPAPQTVAVGGESFGGHDRAAPGTSFRVETGWPELRADALVASRAGDGSPARHRITVYSGQAVPSRAPLTVRQHTARELATREAASRELAGEARVTWPGAADDPMPFVIIDGIPMRPTAPAAPGDPSRPLINYLRALPALPATAWSAGAPAALAGAQVVALDEDLREVLTRGAAVDADAGPVRGVFVLKVLPGPAAEAGLRAGDVVTAADGRMVATPAALQRVLAGRALAERGASGARRTVTLRVWRAGLARDVALRW